MTARYVLLPTSPHPTNKTARVSLSRVVLVLFFLLLTLTIVLLNSFAPPHLADNPPTTPDAAVADPPREELPPSTSMPTVASEILTRCPNWSSETALTFSTRCAAWLTKIDHWQQIPSRAAPSSYVCKSEAACHGLGDRMAGVQTAFSTALEHHRPFRIRWSNLPKLFTSCIFNNSYNGDWGNSFFRTRELCLERPGATCKDFLQPGCPSHQAINQLSVAVACLPRDTCKIIKDAHPLGGDINLADIFGCPLRAIFEPRPAFMDHQVSFFQGNSSSVMTVREIQNIMAQYYIITIHFRLGDLAAFLRKGENENIDEERNPDMLIPFRCAETVQSHLESRPRSSNPPLHVHGSDKGPGETRVDDSYLVNGKPVRWFFASDTVQIRRMAARVFGQRVLMVDEAPRHIAKAKNTDTVLFNTFAEWYLLGLGDELVINKYGLDGITEGHWANKNRLWEGRISSFPKTSWVYHLKSRTYDAYTCRHEELHTDGTWKESLTGQFNCSTRKLGQPNLPQTHLESLPEHFPAAWVLNGQVMVRRT